MDCVKVGKLILSLRKEKNMTQKELADALNLSDRTISKWERGCGCPDVSLLHALSNILGVNIEKILTGDLTPNDMDGGNMKKAKFFACPNCGNVLFGSSEAEISCCGRKLNPLAINDSDDNHSLAVEEIEDEYFITANHDMSKAHFVSFIAYVTFERVLLIKLYPEQTLELRMPKMSDGKLYAYCNQHGLWEQKVV